MDSNGNTFNGQNALTGLYQKLFKETLPPALHGSNFDGRLNQLQKILQSFGYNYPDKLIGDFVLLILKFEEKLCCGEKSIGMLVWFFWVFVIDDKAEKMCEVVLETNFLEDLKESLPKEMSLYDYILGLFPSKLRRSFHAANEDWYNGLKQHFINQKHQIKERLVVHRTRLQSSGVFSFVVGLLSMFPEEEMDFLLDSLAFARISTLQTEFVMITNDIASFQFEDPKENANVIHNGDIKENVQEALKQLEVIEEELRVIYKRNHIPEGVKDVTKFFLWWHCRASRYQAKVLLN